MKIVLVSKCSLDIEQYVEFKLSVLISPSKSLISLCYNNLLSNRIDRRAHLSSGSTFSGTCSRGRERYIVLFICMKELQYCKFKKSKT